jgi:hypothetical protein
MENVTFKSYYDSLPKRKQTGKTRWVMRMAKKCHVQPYSVWRWLSPDGDYEPNEINKATISAYLKLPVEQLFPLKKEEA